MNSLEFLFAYLLGFGTAIVLIELSKSVKEPKNVERP